MASPKKSPKKNGAKPKTKTPKKRKPTSQGAKGTPSKRKPSNSSTPKPKITEKARQKLADIEKAKEDAQWLFGSDSRSDSDRDTDSLDETDIEVCAYFTCSIVKQTGASGIDIVCVCVCLQAYCVY